MFGLLRKPSRLGRWDGRRRSSRGEALILAHLWRRDVLLRLGLVCLTTLSMAFLVYALVPAGPRFAYRIGEIYPHDLRARLDFSMPSSEADIARQEPGIPVKDPSLLEKMKKELSPDIRPPKTFKSGDIIVPAGASISDQHLIELRHEHGEWVESTITASHHLRRGLSLLAIFVLIVSLLCMYVARFQLDLAKSWRSLISICVLFVATLAAGLLVSQAPWDAVFLPMTIAVMILTLAYNPQFSLVVTVSISLMMVVALGMEVAQLLVLLGGLATMILLLRNVYTRTQLVKVSCGAGLVFFALTLMVGLMEGQQWNLLLPDAARRFVWGALAGFLLTGLLPMVERVFGIVTDISLREYADGSHPLLQELVRRAPGTYTHSITVATLAESAAEAIGANPLLVRVGSYFHDVGKMLKPQYFVENQNGENRHDSLEPALSTLIIIGHVKDGIALAKQYNLPRPIIHFIEQHHGTTLVEYFYKEALREHESNGHNGHANGEMEESFRYPGPKPQYREVGVVMLSDAVESASRSLRDPTPTRIRKLVHDLLMKRLLDGQFEESGLTLTELHIVEEALCKSLTALFHARIKYDDDEESASKEVHVRAS